eukprot:65429-Hanusia_phi.AAC.1
MFVMQIWKNLKGQGGWMGQVLWSKTGVEQCWQGVHHVRGTIAIGVGSQMKSKESLWEIGGPFVYNLGVHAWAAGHPVTSLTKEGVYITKTSKGGVGVILGGGW